MLITLLSWVPALFEPTDWRRERWSLSTALRPGLKCEGLESKFVWGPGPLDRSGMFVPGVRARRVFFGAPSWATLIRESPFLRDGTAWLWSSTKVRTGT
jgi:hypothetical protein